MSMWFILVTRSLDWVMIILLFFKPINRTVRFLCSFFPTQFETKNRNVLYTVNSFQVLLCWHQVYLWMSLVLWTAAKLSYVVIKFIYGCPLYYERPLSSPILISSISMDVPCIVNGRQVLICWYHVHLWMSPLLWTAAMLSYVDIKLIDGCLLFCERPPSSPMLISCLFTDVPLIIGDISSDVKL